MREILFRGKTEISERWVVGDLLQWSDGEMCICENRNHFEKDKYRVIPETVGQYTGLTDNNGNKIFEGDIFECYVDYDDSFGYSQTSSFLAVVVWDEKHFCYGMKVDDEIQDFSDWYWESSFLVGNVTDNPELLKGELENGNPIWK